MTAEEVKKVKRTLKKYGFKQHKLLKGFYIKLYNECPITISFKEPLLNTHFMTVVMELNDDYDLSIGSILDYNEASPQRFFDIVDHFNAAIKFINR
jgi:hypothetical protein